MRNLAAVARLGETWKARQGTHRCAEGRIAHTGTRRIYRVEVTAEVPRGALTDWTLRRTVTAVWDTQTQNQNARDPRQNRGAWVSIQER